MAEKILIIDDDRVTLSLFQMTLSKEGYVVVTARDGQEGLALYEREKPDLVITDLLIPKIDGIGVCTKIKETGKTKVIIISGLKNPAIQREAKSCKADAFLEKPIDPHVLNAAILALLTPDRPPR
jgi:DNA-binding response OmpR family regulator